MLDFGFFGLDFFGLDFLGFGYFRLDVSFFELDFGLRFWIGFWIGLLVLDFYGGFLFFWVVFWVFLGLGFLDWVCLGWIKRKIQ